MAAGAKLSGSKLICIGAKLPSVKVILIGAMLSGAKLIRILIKTTKLIRPIKII